MFSESIWRATSHEAPFGPLLGETSADVAIVGGGITGITAAMLLSEQGKSVVVLEAREIGEGTTGHSTGNLYATVGAGLAAIEQKWGEEAMKEVALSRAAAIDLVERIVGRHAIDCDFRRQALWMFLSQGDAGGRERLEKECDAARRAGLAARMADEAPIGFATGASLAIDGQAQFHPLDYVRALARLIASDRCRIFANSEAIDVDPSSRTVRTGAGAVFADRIVMASHTPKGFDLVQTELAPYREYALAATLRSGGHPEGIFWSREEPHHSIRSLAYDGSRYLIVIGERHKTGQAPHPQACYEALEHYTRSRFDVESIDFRWSAQGYYPADGLPYIGRSARSEDLLIATGFSADGLTYGTLAAMILADGILGRANRWADLYKATRIAPVKAARDFVRENLNVAGEYVRDYAAIARAPGIDDAAMGEGRIIEVGGRRCGIYRSDTGKLSAISPICTHLKCVVHWNGAERSWDCPCHGSRFAPDGAVLEGPAPHALESLDLEELARRDDLAA